MDEMQPLIFSINRDQNMSSTHSTVVVYLHCQYKLKHIFTLPKAAWLPMSVPPSRMSCLCGGCPPSCSGCCLPWPCTLAAWRQLSAPNSSCCRGQLGKGHVASTREARWAWMQRGKGFWLPVAVQVPYAQGQA